MSLTLLNINSFDNLHGLRLRHECHPTYLGVTLDCTLYYREHLTKTAGKLKNRNNLLMKSAVICSGALLFSSRVLRSSLVTLCSHKSGRCAVEPPSATVVSAEPFSHGTWTLRCLQKEMATYRHWSVSLWRDPDDVSHCRILSPEKTEWRLISATLCGWRRCFVADQLW